MAGKRSGKSYLLALMFLIMLRKFKGKPLQFSILGATISSVSRNIIPLLEMWTGETIKIGKYNDFSLYGHKITIFGAGNIGALESIRGNTVAGVLINECSMLEEECVKESIDRCSVDDAQVIIDTNPTGFYEYTYTDIISKGDVFNDEGRMLQMCVHFCMLDNTTLPKDYIDQQLMRYPVGTVDYERHILGKYANKEGLIYYMFDERRHILDKLPIGSGVEKYFMGQDFGFGEGHSGVLVVVAKMRDGNFVCVEATVEEGKGIEFWKERALDYSRRYGCTQVYADHARPDLISEMRKTGLTISNADKSVMLGIDYISEMLSSNRLYMLDSLPNICFEEFSRYSWDTRGKESPKKEYDNFLDGLRYALYTEKKINSTSSMYGDVTARKGLQFKHFRG